jgi:hypothetical protein
MQRKREDERHHVENELSYIKAAHILPIEKASFSALKLTANTNMRMRQCQKSGQ